MFNFNYKTYCLICKNNSYGQLFCHSCYNKYSNKTIYAKITNLKYIDVINNFYENNDNIMYICKDGHKVRSKSERDIDNYLFDHKIWHIYEKEYPIDNNPNNNLHPDFYLPELNIYIEHFGIKDDPIYEKLKEKKLKIYKRDKINLITTNEEDMINIESSLDRKLKYFKNTIINKNDYDLF